jgi:hypothetical protein
MAVRSWPGVPTRRGNRAGRATALKITPRRTADMRAKKGAPGGIRKTNDPATRARLRSQKYLLKVVIKSYLYAISSMKSNR